MVTSQIIAGEPPLAGRVSGMTAWPVRDLLVVGSRPNVISFAGGFPDPSFFDSPGFRAAFAEALSDRSVMANLQYSAAEGDPRLRGLLADRLSGRGLPTEADNLLITSGSQQALSILCTTLVDSGGVVLVEAPTYLAALQCFSLAGAHVVAVRGDEGGIDPDAFAAACRRHAPSLLYLVPTFANPTGRTMSVARRRAVLDVALRYGVWIVEDDPYGELRYRGEHLPPMAALPEAGERVIYVGSFSKTGAPGLRLGWIRGRGSLLQTLVIVKQVADLHSSTLDQAAAALFLRDHDFDTHVARLVEHYRLRCETMLSALPTTLSDGSSWSTPDGGMFIWVRMPEGVDTTRLLARALEHDVAFVPGAAFYPADPDVTTLRLAFTMNGPDRIRAGMQRLGKSLQS